MARTGRRPGTDDTRGEILAAARGEFAAKGYHSATIRAIAARAQVDPALVHHYFGNKEDLFAASIDMPIRPAEAIEVVLGAGMESAGENVARLFFSIWEHKETRDPLLAMLRGAFTSEQGANVLREFFGTAMLGRIAPRLDGPDAETRVALMASHLIGVAVLRYVVGFPSLQEVPIDDLVTLVAPRIQSYLTP